MVRLEHPRSRPCLHHEDAGICSVSSRRDLMRKMAILPDWHSLYPTTRKMYSRPHSSPVRVHSRTGCQDLGRPSSSSEYSQVITTLSTDTTYCLTWAQLKACCESCSDTFPISSMGKCRHGPLKVIHSFKVNGQDLNPGCVFLDSVSLMVVLFSKWHLYKFEQACLPAVLGLQKNWTEGTKSPHLGVPLYNLLIP